MKIKVLSVVFSLFFVISFLQFTRTGTTMTFQGFIESFERLNTETELDGFLDTLEEASFPPNPLNLEVMRSKIPEAFKWLANAIYYPFTALYTSVTVILDSVFTVFNFAWSILKIAIAFILWFIGLI